MKHSAWSGRRWLPGLVRQLKNAGYYSFVALVVVGATTVCVGAGEFCVETVVYQQASHKKDEAKPLSRSTTFFTDGWICDVMYPEGSSRAEVLLIDRKNSSATIVGGDPSVACTVSFDEVLRTVAALTTVDQPPLVRFASSPTFETSWDADGKQLRMMAKPISYRARVIDKRAAGKPSASGQSAMPDASDFAQRSADYREFADWSARISATRLGGLPPAARLELNTQLATKQDLPQRVEVTRSWKAGEKVSFFSTHSYVWELTPADRSRLEKWKTRATGMTAVDLVTLRVGKKTTNPNANFGDESSQK